MSQPSNDTDLNQPESDPLDPRDVKTLIEFFTILDRWDREANGNESGKSPSTCCAGMERAECPQK